MKKLFEYNVRRLKYKDKEIQTYSFGTGRKKILSLPSFPHSGIYYILFTQFYDPTKFQVITLDLPGWAGWSENVFAKGEFNPDEYIKILSQIIKEYSLDKFSLIGYSFGGALAIKLAALYPDRITNLALVSTIVKGALLNGSDKKFRLELAKILHQEHRLRNYIFKEFTSYNTIIKDNFNETMLYQYKSMLEQASTSVLFDSLYWLFHADLTPFLKNVKRIKNILIANSKDEPKIFKKQMEYMRRYFDGESSLKISGRHEDFILQPKSEQIKAVLKFLLRD
ncbi:MAG: Alpha/beta hydrolase fold family 3-oxoadipate enol-lactonase [candidate division WS6 bacterium GW2011_GWA2_37_6]|uniref:Alpha/beta hydrolase fold family 3-oxoadipate enol-lactonase n=1 Tax=candidate division WS6 bacterium GW2011_GWA2_37_6 TaxID=1619087 RepID=A0A0G0K2H4_9BACT|nr:MAG: Alpha/beta hydrolase fold family 3-oxoadipate enol-lactonase [candidate division WS6 bacterium GW2011_GWA2_37_6]